MKFRNGHAHRPRGGIARAVIATIVGMSDLTALVRLARRR